MSARWMRDLPGAAVFAVAFLILLASTGSLSGYQLDVGFTLLTFLVIAQAWNILGGFGGQVSLAVSGFVGAGMYTTTLLLEKTSAGLTVSILAAGAVAALGALLFSVPLFRLRAAYFSVGTLALTLTAQAAVVNWGYAGATQGSPSPSTRSPRRRRCSRWRSSSPRWRSWPPGGCAAARSACGSWPSATTRTPRGRSESPPSGSSSSRSS